MFTQAVIQVEIKLAADRAGGGGAGGRTVARRLDEYFQHICLSCCPLQVPHVLTNSSAQPGPATDKIEDLYFLVSTTRLEGAMCRSREQSLPLCFCIP